MFYVEGSVAVPKFLEEKILAQLEKNGLIVNASDIEIFFDARLVAKNITLRFAGTPEPFFKAGKMDVKLSKASLFFGLVRLRSLEISQAALSSTVEKFSQNTLIDKVFLRLDRVDNHWHIRFAEFYLDNFYASISGSIHTKFPIESAFDYGLQEKTSEKSKEPFSIAKVAKNWDEACAKILELRTELKNFSGASLELNFDISEDKIESLFLGFNSDAYNFKSDLLSADLKDFTAKIWLDKPQSRLDSVRTNISALSLTIDSPKIRNKTLTLNSANIKFSAKISDFFADKKAALTNFIAFASDASYDVIKAQNLIARKDFLSLDKPIDSWHLFFRYGSGQTAIKLLGDEHKMTAHIDSQLDFEQILKLDILSEIGDLGKTNFNQPALANGRIDADFDSNQYLIDVDIMAWDCTFLNIPVENLSGNLKYNHQQHLFTATNAKVRTKEGWEIDGNVFQNLENKKYVFEIKGALEPMKIANIMAPWWKKIFAKLKFNADFPHADAYVEGTWGKPEFIWCYASVHAKKVEQNACQFDDFSADILVNPRRISLMNVDIKNNGAWAKFNLQWLYGNDGITHFTHSTLDGTFKFTQREIQALAEDNVSEIFSILTLSSLPEIKINAKMFNSFYDNVPEDIFNVEIATNGPMIVDNLNAESAIISARAQGDTISIDKISAKICQGNIDGSIFLDKLRSKENASINLNLTAKNLQQDEFFDTLASLGKTAEENALRRTQGSGAKSKDPSESAFAGLADAKLEGSASISGKLFDEKTLEGKGLIKCYSPNLGKLFLLGKISRAISTLGVNLATFDVTQIQSPFTLSKDANLSFNRVYVSGPSAKILGTAKYNFVTEDIKAKLYAAPFGSMKTPLISSVFSMIDPFASVFEVRLTEKISDPKISVSLHPLNIFNSDETILKDFGRDLNMDIGDIEEAIKNHSKDN